MSAADYAREAERQAREFFKPRVGCVCCGVLVAPEQADEFTGLHVCPACADKIPDNPHRDLREQALHALICEISWKPVGPRIRGLHALAMREKERQHSAKKEATE